MANLPEAIDDILPALAALFHEPTVAERCLLVQQRIQAEKNGKGKKKVTASAHSVQRSGLLQAVVKKDVRKQNYLKLKDTYK